jgi:hypothetical protein
MPRLRVLPLLALLLLASTASAQPAGDDSARALGLGREALDLFGKSDFRAAFEKFSAADRAAHSPVFVLYMARCRRGAGELLAARELYAGIAGEAVPAGAPEPWQRAHDDAQKELGALDARIPALQLTLRGASLDEAAVTIDGAVVAPAALRAPVRLDPGSHAVVARAPGRRELQQTVRLAEGDPLHRLDLVLEALPALPAPAVATPIITPPPGPATPAPIARKGSLFPGFLALGVGVAGLATGTITGIIARGRADDIKRNCIDGHCLSTDEDRAASANTLATVSTATFLVGGAAAAAGVVLILVRPGGGSASEARLVPGPGSLSLTGSF